MPLATGCPLCGGLNNLSQAQQGSNENMVICGWCRQEFDGNKAVQTMVPQSSWREIPAPPGQTFAPDMGSPVIE